MATLSELKQRLYEAQDALHQLMIGQREVSVQVVNYGMVTYTNTDRAELEHYIAKLKSEISSCEGRGRRRPLYFSF